MSLLRINNLSLSYGGQEVLDSINTEINAGNHIGLVGPNGAGKTTLLRLLTGELEPHGGHIAKSPGLRIGYLPQHGDYHPDQTVWDEIYAGLGEIRDIDHQRQLCETELRNAESANNEKMLQRLAQKYSDLMERYEVLGGSAVDGRIQAMLEGLGISKRLWHSRMDSLSGGERNVVGLARILIGKHDLMLLDEPGNHLDFSGLEWLENLLISSKQAFVIVSHNRYLLDKVCTQIWELQRTQLRLYTGNYSHYRQEKLEEQLRMQSDYNRAQKDIQRLQFNIQRLKAWASVYDNPALARTAKNFERRVEQLKQVEKPSGDGKKMKFRFLVEQPKGDIALDVKNYRIQFDDLPPLVEDVKFLVSKGERVAVVGNNGTGKSTMLKEVIRDGRWENETLRVGKSVRPGYFAQLNENLSLDKSLIENAMRMTGLLMGPASELLHRFLFTRDDLDKPVKVLSGGEKARLQLAVLVSGSADMLLLDEPTNHLDIPSREAVEDALEEFPGTLLFVSHDRYFLDKLADRVLYFNPPAVTVHDGNFTEFWQKQKHTIASDKPLGHTPMDRAETSYTPVTAGKRLNAKKLKFDPQRFKEVEAEIHRVEALRKEVEVELAKLMSKGKDSRADKRRQRIEDIDRQLQNLYDEWVELGERKKKW